MLARDVFTQPLFQEVLFCELCFKAKTKNACQMKKPVRIENVCTICDPGYWWEPDGFVYSVTDAIGETREIFAPWGIVTSWGEEKDGIDFNRAFFIKSRSGTTRKDIEKFPEGEKEKAEVPRWLKKLLAKHQRNYERECIRKLNLDPKRAKDFR